MSTSTVSGHKMLTPPASRAALMPPVHEHACAVHAGGICLHLLSTSHWQTLPRCCSRGYAAALGAVRAAGAV